MTKARDLADLLDGSGNLKEKDGRTLSGRNVKTDGGKLDGIEAAATADQDHSEIRALITIGVDTNVFTDADHTKLDGIEASATADQTDAEIRAAVEAATNSNVFTDADHTKLNAIEASATADQTNAEIRTAVESATNSNVFTDADHTKLNAIEAGATADQTKSDIDALNINADTLDGQHGSYYTGYTDTAVANIVDSSPAALNTLNELAAALGDDPNFATTTSTNIGTKLPKAGGAMTGAITTNSTFDGRNVSVDGTKLDGIEAGANVTDTANVVAALTAGSNITISAGGTIAGAAQYTHPTHAGDDAAIDTGALSGATVISDLDLNITTDTLGHVTDANATVATRNLTLANLGYTGETNATADQTAAQLLTAVKTVDGSGSGLDADLLDGVQLSGLVQRDFQAGGHNLNIASNGSGAAGLFMKSNANGFRFQLYGDGSNYGFLDADWGGWDIQKVTNGAFKVDEGSGLKRVWNEGNDGAGSGLDADLLDGVQGSSYLLTANLSSALTYSANGKSPVGNFGQFEGHSDYPDFNTTPDDWGWTFVGGNTNAPNSNSAQWYRSRLALGDAYAKGTESNAYWLEIAIPRYPTASTGEMWTRTCQAGTIGAWREVGGGATPRYSSAPSVATEGSFYWHTTEDQLYVSDGTVWTSILSKPPAPTGGTVTLPTAAFGTSYSYNFGSNVVDPVFADDQLTYVLQSGSIPAGLSVTQNLTGSSTVETTGTYNFTVSITNPNGASALQSYTMTATGLPNNSSNGEAIFTSTGNWTVPAGVSNICVVAVGAGGAGYSSYAGGGGGGGLAWANQINVSPGDVYTVTVGQGGNDLAGGQSNFIVSGQGVLRAFGGGTTSTVTGAVGGGIESNFAYTGGGNGGNGGNGISPNPAHYAGGGGGAGGYGGNGGNGGGYNGNGTNGAGGGGGGGGHKISSAGCGFTWGAGGGGVGLDGQGSNGSGGGSTYPGCAFSGTAPSGGGGSGGASGLSMGVGGLYGGGGPSGYSSQRRGGHGAVRIVWKTAAKGTYGFPSSNVG